MGQIALDRGPKGIGIRLASIAQDIIIEQNLLHHTAPVPDAFSPPLLRIEYRKHCRYFGACNVGYLRGFRGLGAEDGGRESDTRAHKCALVVLVLSKWIRMGFCRLQKGSEG